MSTSDAHQAFTDAVDAYLMPHASADAARDLPAACGQVWNCGDQLPASARADAMAMSGGDVYSYAQAARALKAALRRMWADAPLIT